MLEAGSARRSAMAGSEPPARQESTGPCDRSIARPSWSRAECRGRSYCCCCVVSVAASSSIRYDSAVNIISSSVCSPHRTSAGGSGFERLAAELSYQAEAWIEESDGDPRLLPGRKMLEVGGQCEP